MLPDGVWINAIEQCVAKEATVHSICHTWIAFKRHIAFCLHILVPKDLQIWHFFRSIFGLFGTKVRENHVNTIG